MITAIILSIGDELVLGQTVDTNSAWLSQRLAAIGVRILGHATVPDDQRGIEEAMTAAARCDVLLISGGLGPTEDDLTRQALATVLGVPLELNEQALRDLSAWFDRLQRPMAASNRIQAMFPRGTTPIANTCGTAPGIHARFQISNFKSDIYVMPGVPKEMKAMFIRDVLPALELRAGGAAIVSRTLHTFGAGESTIGEMLGDLMDRQRNPSVGTTVSGGVVSVRVNAYFPSRPRAFEELERTAAECRRRLGDLIYGQDEQTLAGVLADVLKDSRKAVATAESCTGGLLAKFLTDVPGSSAYFLAGWVTYSNAAKTRDLGVSEQALAAHGAVSEQVVREMAAGARAKSGADYALSISGVAGPEGGTDAKPVGTVCIGLASAEGTEAKTFRMFGDREMIRDRSAKMAMTMLRFALAGKRLPF